jgi:RND superfamily putative drug exporter
MSRTLAAVGRYAATHPWRTIGLWAVVAAAVFSLAAAFGGPTREDWDVPAAPAQHGTDLLRAHLPEMGNTSAQVVVHDDAPLPSSTLDELSGRLATLDHVLRVTPPRMSADGDTAVLVMQYDVPVTDPDVYEDISPIEKVVQPYRDAGLQVELGGELPGTAVGTMEGVGEMIGIGVALLVLLLVFRSVVAAGVPIVLAVAGLAVGGAGVTVLAGLISVTPYAPTIATMVGLGVGIDYALLLLTRMLEGRRAGLSVVESAARAGATAGRSVVLAGCTVLVSLRGLKLAGLTTFSTMGFATAIAVVAVMGTSLTLVPAVFRLTHRWVEKRFLRQVARPRGTRVERWSQRVAGRPVPWIVGAGLVMIVLAAPVLDMRTWPQSGSDDPASSQLRRAYDLVTEEFGVGAPTPYLFVADRSVVDAGTLAGTVAELRQRDDLVNVTDPQVSPDGAIAVVSAESVYVDNDARTGDQVDSLRSGLPDGVDLTGTSPMMSDIADRLAGRLWLVIAFVVATSMLLLLLMFRSVWIPVKAAAMNLLSVAAAYGVVTAVFQWGWGLELLGVDHARPVSTWLPILMFAILFGLSMDYEVYLLSRVREEYERTGDPRGSVARGLAATGTVITAAAAIMVAVFFGFISESATIIKMLGFGMGTAILLDATLVRMVLVPATMTLLGHRNWWLPAWLDRVLPRVSLVEEVAQEPSRDPSREEAVV